MKLPIGPIMPGYKSFIYSDFEPFAVIESQFKCEVEAKKVFANYQRYPFRTTIIHTHTSVIEVPPTSDQCKSFIGGDAKSSIDYNGTML